MLKNTMSKLGAVCAIALLMSGCNSLTPSQRNTAVGAAVGGVAGNVIGGNTASTLGGAALGGVIGSQIDK